jgi:hypothetical protein
LNAGNVSSGCSDKVPCLNPVEAFDDAQKLLEAVELHSLEGVVSKSPISTLSIRRVRRLCENKDADLSQSGAVAVVRKK